MIKPYHAPIFAHDLYGKSNAISVIAREPHGNSSQFVLIRRPHGSKGHLNGEAKVDWCILVGELEMAHLIECAGNMLTRFSEQKQCTEGGRGEDFVRIRVEDNSGNYKCYIDFTYQRPVALSQGREDRWRIYFDDPEDVRDFLGLVSKIDMHKGRMVGSTELSPWPCPQHVRNVHEYSEVADRIEGDDPEGELYPVVGVLRAMADGKAMFGHEHELGSNQPEEKVLCLDCHAEFVRPQGQSWRTRCYACWSSRMGRT